MPDDLADDLQSLSFGSSGRSAATTDTSTTASSSGSGPISASAPSISPAPSGCDSSCCCPKRSDPDQKPLRMTDFRFLRRLGSGDIGTVYLAQLVSVDNCPGCHKTKPNPQTAPRLLAAKVMDKEELHGRNKQGRAKAELEILKMLDHPFLPKLIASAEDNRWACLLTDFCPGGDLHVLRQRQPYKRFPEAAVRFYAAEVVVALEYLHMLGVVYRDLKPENVLVRADGHIMLTDFDLSLRCGDSASNPRLLGLSGDKAGNYDTAISCGNGIPTAPGLLTGSSQGSTVGSGGGGISASCILPSCIVPAVSCFNNGSSRRSFRSRKDKKSSKKNKKACDALEFVAEPVGARSMSFVGTHEYLAPEIVSGEGHGSAVDWWTLGVLLFELLYGYTPFRGHDNDMTLANIVARALEFPKENNSGGGKGDKRGGRFGDDYCGPPTVSQQAKDLISGLLVKDPCRRLGSATGAAAVKRHPFFHGVNWALLRCAKPPLVPPPLPSSLFVQEAGQSNTIDGASFSSLSAGMGGMVKDNAGECCTDDEEEHDDNRRSDGCSGADSRRNSGDIGVVLVYPAAVGETSPPGSPVDFY